MYIPELFKTADGSDTLFVREINEHYHSTFGAVQESKHIFIAAGLQKCTKPFLNLFEVGFGTGLNTYLTVLETIKTNQTIRYITIEKYPLPFEIWDKLNYPALIEAGNPELFQMIHRAAWNEEVQITDRFTLLKISSDLADVDYAPLPAFDLIYFDAFSPEKQPDLWDISIFSKLSEQCASRAKLVTYCAKGAVRRSLQDAGFAVERIPGPPGKREMLRGTKNEQSSITDHSNDGANRFSDK